MPAKALEVPQKGSGNWAVRVNHNGVRKLKFIGKGEKSKEKAIKIAKTINKQIQSGNLDFIKTVNRRKENQMCTFQIFVERWLDKIQINHKRAMNEDYKGMLKKHVLSTFGEKIK